MEVTVEYRTRHEDADGIAALAIRPQLSPEHARILSCEGLWQDGDRWIGPVAYFRAALPRLAAVNPEAARRIGSALHVEWSDAAVRVHAPGARPERTLVMGILNVTPDSFYDGGRFADPDRAVERARAMAAEGADIIDVGGESTRPNADPVPAQEELRRVIPVIRALVREIEVPISIDTYKAEVARAALAEGATMVNDISGLRFDPRMAEVVAEFGASVVIMHTRGTPKTMQLNPHYDDVVREVRDYLARSCERALAAGVRPEGIWIDPGFGFGKTVQHNLTLLARLRELRSLGFPILVGTSNKSMIGRVLGLDVNERQEGTAATVAVAIANGADAVRVHDVAAMVRVARMTDAVVRGWREQA